MNQLTRIETAVGELEAAFAAIQMPRTPYQIEHFVVGQHDTEPRRYVQCVLELQIKYDNIRRAILNRKLIEAQIQKLEARGDEIAQIRADMKRLDIEAQDRAMLGAEREFWALYQIWKSFPHQYTRQEIDAAEESYWQQRLERQAQLDIAANGRIGVGNADALRMIGEPVGGSASKIEAKEPEQIADGQTKVLVAVATEEKAVDGIPQLEGLDVPDAVATKILNVYAMPVADAYNKAAIQCLQDGARYLLIVEAERQVPPGVLRDLLAVHARDGADVVAAQSLGLGCYLIDMHALREHTYPWFGPADDVLGAFLSRVADEGLTVGGLELEATDG